MIPRCILVDLNSTVKNMAWTGLDCAWFYVPTNTV